MRRAAAAFIAIFITIGASACNKDDEKKKKLDEQKEPFTITMFSSDVNNHYEYFNSPVAKKITEKTGAVLDIEYPVGELQQKIGLMIASKEYPDLIFTKGADRLVNAGAFIDMTELINKHGHNIKKFYGKYLNRLKYSSTDNSIYILSCNGVNEERWIPNTGFQLQHAVVKELGYPKLETLEDFENAIRQYINKYPTINGERTIGLSLIADDWRWKVSVGNPAGLSTGKPDDGQWYVDTKTYDAVYRFTRPEEKEYFRWLNHMNNIKLLDPDSFVQKYNQYISKIASGRILALSDAKWQYLEAEAALVSSGKPERTYGMYPLVMKKEYKYADFRDIGYTAGWGVGISTSCKDPEKVFKFLDWMCSEEAQILNNWGIEGVHYKIVDGKRTIPEDEWIKRSKEKDYMQKTGIGVYIYPFPQHGYGVKDSTGQPFSPFTKESIMKQYNQAEVEVLNAYGKKTWADFYPKNNELTPSPYGNAWQINIPEGGDLAYILESCDEVMKRRIPQAVLSSPAEFDVIWEDIMNELKKRGVENAGREFTKLVKDRIKAWNTP